MLFESVPIVKYLRSRFVKRNQVLSNKLSSHFQAIYLSSGPYTRRSSSRSFISLRNTESHLHYSQVYVIELFRFRSGISPVIQQVQIPNSANGSSTTRVHLSQRVERESSCRVSQSLSEIRLSVELLLSVSNTNSFSAAASNYGSFTHYTTKSR